MKYWGAMDWFGFYCFIDIHFWSGLDHALEKFVILKLNAKSYFGRSINNGI